MIKRLRPRSDGRTYWYILIDDDGDWQLAWYWFQTSAKALIMHQPYHFITFEPETPDA